MTGSWLTLSDVARRISEATGRRVSLEDVIELGADDGPLKAQFMHGYWSVSEESVTAYLLSVSEPDASSGALLAEHADKPTVRGGPELPADIEDEYERGEGAE
jgi:hypothetical protein